MAEVMQQRPASGSTSRREKAPEVPIPEMIEERRKDSEGRIVSNKYLRGKLLGKGGFAKCYLGTSMQSNNQYALKIVAKNTLVKQRAKQKLQTEIKIHRTLNHPNVVRFERFFEDNSNAYMLLELCANNSMSDLMKRRKKLCEYEARFYMVQLVNSLKYLHQHAVIHRDLKLGNLFIDHNMCVKVGDFGLATRLSSPDERKKTVCGTPNYIAPEILEGKDGHSFEVDIWSTGVILYTLLIGKPPFESKDVKSTYKRIVANQYCFPDHTPVCEHAKNLIRHMLQARPEKRPKLDTILNHSFFTRPTAYTPHTLPESALREMPPAASPAQMQQYAQKVGGQYPSQATAGVKRGSDSTYSDKHGNGDMHQANDENDPYVLNRVASSNHAQMQGKNRGLSSTSTQNPLATRPRSGSGGTSKDLAPVQLRRGSSTGSTNSQGSTAGCDSSSHQVQHQQQSRGVLSAAPGVSGDKVRSGTSGSTTGTGSGSGSGNNYALNPPRGTGVQSRSGSSQNNPSAAPSSRGGYAAKFDIYTDTKGANNNKQLPPAPLSTRSTSSGATTRDGGLASVSAGDAMDVMDIDHIQTELDGVHIGKGQNGQNGQNSEPASLASMAAGNPQPVRAQQDGNRKPSEAWAYDNQKNEDAFRVNGNGNNGNGNERAMPPAPPTATDAVDMGARNTYNTASCQQGQDEPDAMTTPAQAEERRLSARRPLDTLETMHDMLNRPYNGMNTDGGMADRASPEKQDLVATSQVSPGNMNSMNMHTNQQVKQQQWAAPASVAANHVHAQHAGSTSPNSVSKMIARVWVVRYVDYTSKYGLGFLLNTGSAGVYFNDSTKIVLSADGMVFQYIERRRKDGQVNSEHISQTHLMSAYPMELQKKVTLLRHFRNYLVDQQKTYGAGQGQGQGDTGADSTSALESVSSLPMVLPEGAKTGADASIPFGTSSAAFEAEGAVEMGSPGGIANNNPSTMSNANANTNNGETETIEDMPFLKKWVRTRHAILFRLSNRIVQVVFFDRSEVLLSSEARVVTYVNKQGDREDHSLEDVLHTGRTDIAKRLKYTKDIMYRLINVAK